MSCVHLYAFMLGFCLWVSQISYVVSQKCSSLKFANSNVYTYCLDLPTLSSYLHYTYNSSNSTLIVSFAASPAKSNGWIAWAMNPAAPAMAGAQALLAYKSEDGNVIMNTYNISGYTGDSIVEGKLAFDVWDTGVEQDSGGVMRIFARVKLPAELAAKGKVNYVWQVGHGMQDGKVLPHDMSTQNLQAKSTLDLNGGESLSNDGGSDIRTKRKNIHGILNAVSWGVLFPTGVIIARYLRTFQSTDPAWFHLHVFFQVSAYAIGVAGWETGLQLGIHSKGIQWTGHRNIGIALFSLATVQIFALFLRPKKDHKFRSYWNAYHHAVGYSIVILGILNVFKGLDILQPEGKWKTAYTVVIAALGGIAVLLELITWGVVLKGKMSSSIPAKPYDGINGEGREHPLTA